MHFSSHDGSNKTGQHLGCQAHFGKKRFGKHRARDLRALFGYPINGVRMYLIPYKLWRPVEQLDDVDGALV
jgi:hypothetical protein